MIMFDFSRLIPNFLSQIFTDFHALIKFMRSFKDRFVHESNIIDRMNHHLINNLYKINYSFENVIMLKDHYKWLRYFIHHMTNILSKAIPLCSFFDCDKRIASIFGS